MLHLYNVVLFGVSQKSTKHTTILTFIQPVDRFILTMQVCLKKKHFAPCHPTMQIHGGLKMLVLLGPLGRDSVEKSGVEKTTFYGFFFGGWMDLFLQSLW